MCALNRWLNWYTSEGVGINLVLLFCWFFPKRFAVGVLNAILDLVALVLVDVAAFLGSEVVLTLLDSLHVNVGGGWSGRLLGLWSGLGSLWLPPCKGWCWLVWPPSWALKWSWLPLAHFMWGWVLVLWPPSWHNMSPPYLQISIRHNSRPACKFWTVWKP